MSAMPLCEIAAVVLVHTHCRCLKLTITNQQKHLSGVSERLGDFACYI